MAVYHISFITHILIDMLGFSPFNVNVLLQPEFKNNMFTGCFLLYRGRSLNVRWCYFLYRINIYRYSILPRAVSCRKYNPTKSITFRRKCTTYVWLIINYWAFSDNIYFFLICTFRCAVTLTFLVNFNEKDPNLIIDFCSTKNI